MIDLLNPVGVGRPESERGIPAEFSAISLSGAF